MEDAGTTEEDDIDSQDSNTPIDHGHLARNCLIKITTLAVKASVISLTFRSASGSIFKRNVPNVEDMIFDVVALRSVVSHELGISTGTVSNIIHSVLMMSKVSLRWVSRMLTPEQTAI